MPTGGELTPEPVALPIPPVDNIAWEDERSDSHAPENKFAGNYSNYAQDHSYGYDSGVVAAPLASREAGIRVIRLHGGVQTRKMDWVAARSGKPPIIPAAKDTQFDKLLSATAVVGLPVPNRDAGGYNWTVRGSYLYVEAAPRIPGVNVLPTGYYPYRTEPANTLEEAAYLSDGGAIAAGFAAAESAAASDPTIPPVAAVDIVAMALTAYSDPVTGPDQQWPFTFLSPLYSTDEAIDT